MQIYYHFAMTATGKLAGQMPNEYEYDLLFLLTARPDSDWPWSNALWFSGQSLAHLWLIHTPRPVMAADQSTSILV